MDEPRDEQASNKPKFFAVDQQPFHRACDLGLGPAVAYVTLAMFTGRDQSTTSAGVNSIENYTGLSRGRAQEALKILHKEKLFKHRGKVVRVGSHVIQPRRLVLPARTKRQPIWLPNQIITGAAGEQPPVAIIREMGDVLTLRLFIDLYDIQLLPDYWGIDSRIIWRSWDRKHVGERGEWVIWGFEQKSTTAVKGPLSLPHIRTSKAIGGKDDWGSFWSRLQSLVDAGLIEWIPTLMSSDSEDAQAIMPIRGTLEPETILADAISSAAENMLMPEMYDRALNDNLLLVPVRRHLKDCALRSIARTKYRAQTKPTSRWFAQICEVARLYVPIYQKLAGKNGMQDQGYIKDISRIVQC